jgi:hypothetical protein
MTPRPRRRLALAAVTASAVATLPASAGAAPNVSPTSPGYGHPTAKVQAAMHGAVRGGRFVKTLQIGTVRIVPAGPAGGNRPVGLSRATVAVDAGLATGMESTPTLIGFGLVTVGVGVTGLPALRSTPAWVAIAPPSHTPIPCPMQSPASPTVTPTYHHGVYSALILFGAVADGGQGAAIYHSAGDLPCDAASTGPEITAASATIPVVWTLTGPASTTITMRYQAPECATSAGFTSTGSGSTQTVTVRVTVPFDRAGCAGLSTFTEYECPPAATGCHPKFPPTTQVVHAPIPAGIPVTLTGALPS